jgi:hypothetical protein
MWAFGLLCLDHNFSSSIDAILFFLCFINNISLHQSKLLFRGQKESIFFKFWVWISSTSFSCLWMNGHDQYVGHSIHFNIPISKFYSWASSIYIYIYNLWQKL